MAKAAQDKHTTEVNLPKLDVRTIQVTVVGDSPLISHAWSDRIKKAMIDKQTGTPNAGKEKKDPERDYEESLYRLKGGGYGFPAVAFKAAAVGACRFVDGIPMTEARGAFHIVGDMVEIQGKPSPREDMVRVAMSKADIRYRAEFREWSAKLTIRYNHAAITPAQIVNLLNIAGFGVGIGDWRPAKNGSFGMFHAA